MHKNKIILFLIFTISLLILPITIKAEGFECRHVNVTVPEGMEEEEQVCINKYYSCEQESNATVKVWQNCTGWGADPGIDGCNGIGREAWLVNPTNCPADYKTNSQFQPSYDWGDENMAYCSCVEACGEQPQTVDCLPTLSQCCQKLVSKEEEKKDTEDTNVEPEAKTEDQPDEMQDIYKEMLKEIEVPECSEQYPELCVLSKEDRDKIIDWFYNILMVKLKANFKHSATVTDASGDKKINWGAPVGWLQRIFINGYKLIKYRDTRPDASIVENLSMGTCGDVMAYINQTFPKVFPNIKVTSIAMAWGPAGFFNHGSNVVMPINPKTKKQYKESEIPPEVFNAKTGEELPVEWQKALVIDGWGRSVYTLKNWYNEYKHGDGDFLVGD